MMRSLSAFCTLVLLALAGCGADGEPERPEAATPEPGLSISGRVEVGIVGSN